jgi:hypothetical protein
MRAIMWKGHAGPTECDASPRIIDDTDALVWMVNHTDHGLVVEVGDEVGSIEVGDFVTVPDSVGNACRSSSLWGLTEFVEEEYGHLARVPLAELNLFLVTGADAA